MNAQNTHPPLKSLLRTANNALTQGENLKSIKLYHDHAAAFPELDWLDEVNIGIARSRGLRLQKNIPMSKKRAVIFASYNHSRSIDAYVLHYLSKLRNISNLIIFIGDYLVDEIEKKKLQGIADKIIFERHREYDFGSYKRGFSFLAENNLLESLDELVFCNDSCYGPTQEFSWIFYEMSERKVDFWGITQNSEFCNHIQSYFFVLQKKSFLSTAFKEFIESVKIENCVQDVIKNYEIKLTSTLSHSGLLWDTLIKPSSPGLRRLLKSNPNPTFFPSYLLRAGAQLIKVKALSNESCSAESTQEVINLISNQNCTLGKIVLEHQKKLKHSVTYTKHQASKR